MHCFVYYIYNAYCIWFISCFFFFSFISNNFSACWRQLCSLFQHLWFQSAWLSSTPKWIVRANPPCRLAGPQCWHLSHVFVNCQLESSLYSFLIKLGNNFHRESGSRHEVDWRERGGGNVAWLWVWVMDFVSATEWDAQQDCRVHDVFNARLKDINLIFIF